MQGCRIGFSPKSLGMIELDDYTGIEESAQSHEGLQGVPLNKPIKSQSSRRATKTGML